MLFAKQKLSEATVWFLCGVLSANKATGLKADNYRWDCSGIIPKIAGNCESLRWFYYVSPIIQRRRRGGFISVNRFGGGYNGDRNEEVKSRWW